MTIEEAKIRAKLYLALTEGKIIQVKNSNGTWEDINIERLNNIYDCNRYRIKPESKYRPFKTQEECWNEMLKHHPFGWIKSNEDGHYTMVTAVDNDVITISGNNLWPFEDTMNNYTFTDGTPFGIKEE